MDISKRYPETLLIHEKFGLASGVELLVDAFKPILVNVGINLGCCNISMTEHHLHRA